MTRRVTHSHMVSSYLVINFPLQMYYLHPGLANVAHFELGYHILAFKSYAFIYHLGSRF